MSRSPFIAAGGLALVHHVEACEALRQVIASVLSEIESADRFTGRG